jgi:cytochrome c oxidase assembly factor CtaG
VSGAEGNNRQQHIPAVTRWVSRGVSWLKPSRIGYGVFTLSVVLCVAQVGGPLDQNSDSKYTEGTHHLTTRGHLGLAVAAVLLLAGAAAALTVAGGKHHDRPRMAWLLAGLAIVLVMGGVLAAVLVNTVVSPPP